MRTVLAVIAIALLLAGCSGPSDLASLGPGFRSEVGPANGTRLHYVIGGRGPPVVLLHGFPETWMAWRKVMPALAAGHTVVAVDMRGVGGSALEKTGYDKETLATDVHRLVAHLGLGQVSLVGDDFGGQVAYAYARMHRNEVRGLVVIETALPGFGAESLYSGSYHFLFHMVPDLPERLIKGNERGYLTRFVCGPERDCKKASVSPSLVESYVRAYSRPGRLSAAFEYYRALPRDADANPGRRHTEAHPAGAGAWRRARAGKPSARGLPPGCQRRDGRGDRRRRALGGRAAPRGAGIAHQSLPRAVLRLAAGWAGKPTRRAA